MSSGSDVTVQIISADDRLTVQLPFGSHTRTFLQEVSRCSAGTSSIRADVSVPRALAVQVLPPLSSPACGGAALASPCSNSLSTVVSRDSPLSRISAALLGVSGGSSGCSLSPAVRARGRRGAGRGAVAAGGGSGRAGAGAGAGPGPGRPSGRAAAMSAGGRPRRGERGDPPGWAGGPRSPAAVCPRRPARGSAERPPGSPGAAARPGREAEGRLRGGSSGPLRRGWQARSCCRALAAGAPVVLPLGARPVPPGGLPRAGRALPAPPPLPPPLPCARVVFHV